MPFLFRNIFILVAVLLALLCGGWAVNNALGFSVLMYMIGISADSWGSFARFLTGATAAVALAHVSRKILQAVINDVF